VEAEACWVVNITKVARRRAGAMVEANKATAKTMLFIENFLFPLSRTI
jgi:hypothetical protein